MKMTGNTILITGGTSGIGRALAEAFYERQNTVIVAGRRQNLLDEMTARYPGIVGIPLDLADSQAVDAFAKQVRERFPKLNVLINNAGIAGREDYTAEVIDTSQAVSIINTNITSVVQLSAALLPSLRAQPEAALMVNTSGLAFVAYAPGPTYSATKAFLHNWLDAVRFQLRDSKVEVLELIPPYVQTELGGPQQAVDPRAMPLGTFIEEVLQILAEGKTPKGEILVENVKPLRWAERNGQYEHMLAMLGSI